MQKKLVILVAVLLVCATLGAFAGEKKSAQIPFWYANTPGTTELGVGATWEGAWGFGANAGLSIDFGAFDAGPIPIAYGVTVLGQAGFGYGITIGAGAFFTLQTGWDFGGIARFEETWGIGPGATIEIYSGIYPGFGIGTFDTFTWWFSPNLGLYLEEDYIYSFGWYGGLSGTGIGVNLVF